MAQHFPVCTSFLHAFSPPHVFLFTFCHLTRLFKQIVYHGRVFFPVRMLGSSCTHAQALRTDTFILLTLYTPLYL